MRPVALLLVAALFGTAVVGARLGDPSEGSSGGGGLLRCDEFGCPLNTVTNPKRIPDSCADNRDCVKVCCMRPPADGLEGAALTDADLNEDGSIKPEAEQSLQQEAAQASGGGSEQEGQEQEADGQQQQGELNPTQRTVKGGKPAGGSSGSFCPFDLVVIADISSSILFSEENPDFNAAGLRRTVMSMFDAVVNRQNPEQKADPNRVALVTFSDGATTELGLSTPQPASFQKLVDSKLGYMNLHGRTNHAAAFIKAGEVIKAAKPRKGEHTTLVLMLTDGVTTVPPMGDKLKDVLDTEIRSLSQKPLFGLVFVGNQNKKMPKEFTDTLPDGTYLWSASTSFDATATVNALLKRVCASKPPPEPYRCKKFFSTRGECPTGTKNDDDRLDELCGPIEPKAWRKPACCSRRASSVRTDFNTVLSDVADKNCLTLDELAAANPVMQSSGGAVPAGVVLKLPVPRRLCDVKNPFYDCRAKCCKLTPPDNKCKDYKCTPGTTQIDHLKDKPCSSAETCQKICCREVTDCEKPVVENRFTKNGQCDRNGWDIMAKTKAATNELSLKPEDGECELKYDDKDTFWAWWKAPAEFHKAVRAENSLIFVQRTTIPVACRNGAPKNGKCPRGEPPAMWSVESEKLSDKNLADVIVTVKGLRYGYNYPRTAQWWYLYKRLNFNGPVNVEHSETDRVRREIDFSNDRWGPIKNNGGGELYIPPNSKLGKLPAGPVSELLIRSEYIRGDVSMKGGEVNYLLDPKICPTKEIISGGLAPTCQSFQERDGCPFGSDTVTTPAEVRKHCVVSVSGNPDLCKKAMCPTERAYRKTLEDGKQCAEAFVGLTLPPHCQAACSRPRIVTNESSQQETRDEWKDAGCGAPLQACDKICCKSSIKIREQEGQQEQEEQQ